MHLLRSGRVGRDGAELLRAGAVGNGVGVDRKANVLRGMVVAMEGDFKSPGRGSFDGDSLREIVTLGNGTVMGLRSRFSHPTECADGLGKHLGRVRHFRLGTATTWAGQDVPAVRADLYFDDTALRTPVGGGIPLGEYVMDLAESDSDAISSSLVLRAQKEYRVDRRGIKLKDAEGEDLPPLWRPTKLWASDVVDTGDAVDGILSGGSGLPGGISAENLPNSALWKGSKYLDQFFTGQTRDEVAGQILEVLDRYLDDRFGSREHASASPRRVPDLRMLEVRQRQREREAGIF